MKIKIRVDGKKLHKILNDATGHFIDMESKSIHNVNVESCMNDFIKAVLIYNETIYTIVD